MPKNNIFGIGTENTLSVKIQPDWDWKKQNALLKTRCIGCNFACSEEEKIFCDPDGGAAN